ncbi:MAG: sterol-binding protein [Streptosporangiales bacterium]|nr:sterol-binding protein [Streptosporangiales bacterium]
MATLEECQQAIDGLAQKIQESGDKSGLGERTLSCHVSDLDVTFHGTLRRGELVDVTTQPQPKAQIRFTATSDDLVAMVDGSLDMAKAWLTKRVKVEASMMDILKLKAML